MEQLINEDYNVNLTKKLINENNIENTQNFNFNENDIEKIQKSNFNEIEIKINSVKEQMVDNIQEALNRKQNIDNIIETTETLESTSLKFNNSAIKLKKEQCWGIWRCKVYIIIILLFTIFLVILFSCKFNLKTC